MSLILPSHSLSLLFSLYIFSSIFYRRSLINKRLLPNFAIFSHLTNSNFSKFSPQNQFYFCPQRFSSIFSYYINENKLIFFSHIKQTKQNHFRVRRSVSRLILLVPAVVLPSGMKLLLVQLVVAMDRLALTRLQITDVQLR